MLSYFVKQLFRTELLMMIDIYTLLHRRGTYSIVDDMLKPSDPGGQDSVLSCLHQIYWHATLGVIWLLLPFITK